MNIYKAYSEIGVYDEALVGHVIATVAEILLDTTTIKYGEEPGNFHYYDARMSNAHKSTYFMNDWNWNNPNDPLAAYNGNSGQPKLDCAAFVGLVLDIAGITKGTEKRDYNSVKGLNLIGNSNGVRNIIESGLFQEVKSGKVQVGDLAVYKDFRHIMIVAQTSGGKAINFIHSSSYNYNAEKRDSIGVQMSKISGKTYATLKYYRFVNLYK